MEASKPAKDQMELRPGLHLSATALRVGQEDTSRRPLRSNALTRRHTASAALFYKYPLNDQASSATPSAESLPSSMIDDPRFSESDQTIRESCSEPPYHVSTSRQKCFLVLLVSLAASFSPLSSNIYFPALDLIADALNIDNSTFATSVSLYMVAQGLAPSFWGPIADVFGRRQILIYTLLLYVAACAGIALSKSFPVLMLFRFLQAAGSSSTISIGAGVIADIVPPGERGGFIGMFAGVRQFAMAIGPVLGGVIAHLMGFRAIFWFLVILGGFATVIILFFLPETLRQIAGNGSIPLTNVRHQPLCEKLRKKKDTSRNSLDSDPPPDTTNTGSSRTNITYRDFLSPFLFLLEKDVACALYFGAVVYTVWSMMTTSTPFLFIKYFKLDTLQIALCFIPNGVGCVVGSAVGGRQLDHDFRTAEDSYRYKWNLPHSHHLPKQELPGDFPLERARLRQMPGLLYIFVFGVLVYGFSLNAGATLALPLIAQFVVGCASTAVLNLNNTLTVDLYPGKGASATAVNNFARCLLGAVGVSLTEVALQRMEASVLFAVLAGLVFVSMPAVMAEWRWGMRWRKGRMERVKSKEKKKRETREVNV